MYGRKCSGGAVIDMKNVISVRVLSSRPHLVITLHLKVQIYLYLRSVS